MSTNVLQDTVKGDVEDLKKIQKTITDKAIKLKDDAGPVMAKYKDDIQEKAKNIKPAAMELKNQVVKQLTDMSPVTESDVGFVVSTYSWLVVCFVAFSLAQIPGMMFAPVFNIITGPIVMFINIVVLMPTVLVMYMHKTQMNNEESHKITLMGAAASGLLDGYSWSGRALTFYIPPAVLAVIGITTGAGLVKSKNRQVFLGACLGCVLAGYVLFGLAFGLSPAYLAQMVIHLTAFGIDLQLKLGRSRAGGAKVGAEQMITLVMFSTLVNIAMFMHGMNPEDAAAINAKQ